MSVDLQKDQSLVTLFTRFILGFGAGFVGMIVLVIILFSFQHIVGDFLVSPDQLVDDLGSAIGQIQTNPLFLTVITLAVFVSTLVTTMLYVFLNILVEPKYNKKSTTLTHVFFANVILLLLFLPVYVAVNQSLQTEGVRIVAILHAILACFFSVLVLQVLHQVEYTFVNLYGNIFGLLLFLFLSVVFGSGMSSAVLIFLSFPLFMGSMAFGNRMVEMIYAFFFRQFGLDMLNLDTTFGDDYGVQRKDKDFNEDEAFEKEFKV